MPLDDTSNNGGGFGGDGEMPRKPHLPRDVAAKIRGAEHVLEQLAYAILDRKGDSSPRTQLECMEINDNVKETIGRMMNELTDARFDMGCHDPRPHVDFETAEAYVMAAVEHINAKVGLASRFPSLRPKEMTGKVVAAWDPTQIEKFPLQGMDRQ